MLLFIVAYYLSISIHLYLIMNTKILTWLCSVFIIIYDRHERMLDMILFGIPGIIIFINSVVLSVYYAHYAILFILENLIIFIIVCIPIIIKFSIYIFGNFSKDRFFNNTSYIEKKEDSNKLIYIDYVDSIIMEEYDIIVLRNMYITGSFNVKNMINNGFIFKFNYYVAPTLPKISSYRFIDNGLLILSKLPIVEVDYLSFDNNSIKNIFAERGVQYAKILYEKNKYICVFNSNYDWTDSKETDQISKFINKKKLHNSISDTINIFRDYHGNTSNTMLVVNQGIKCYNEKIYDYISYKFHGLS